MSPASLRWVVGVDGWWGVCGGRWLLVSGKKVRRVCEGENSVCGTGTRQQGNLEPRDDQRLPEAMHTEQRLDKHWRRRVWEQALRSSALRHRVWNTTWRVYVCGEMYRGEVQARARFGCLECMQYHNTTTYYAFLCSDRGYPSSESIHSSMCGINSDSTNARTLARKTWWDSR